MTGPKSWKLYWVESDGFEDCFVVARNSRSARSVEYRMNGFDFSYVRATKIMTIPKKVELFYRRQKSHLDRPWPYYIYGKAIFEKLGAQFRTIDEKEEMLLSEVVYEVDDYRPCDIRRSRSIGFKAVDELRRLVPEVWPAPGLDDTRLS